VTANQQFENRCDWLSTRIALAYGRITVREIWRGFFSNLLKRVLLSPQMFAPRVHLVALLILALICCATQCVAARAADSGKPAAPPCHPQHASSAACSQDFELPAAHAVLIHVTAVDFQAPALETPLLVVAAPVQKTIATSPPDPAFSPGILRI
jgi:hypothetical protein